MAFEGVFNREAVKRRLSEKGKLPTSNLKGSRNAAASPMIKPNKKSKFKVSTREYRYGGNTGRPDPLRGR